MIEKSFAIWFFIMGQWQPANIEQHVFNNIYGCEMYRHINYENKIMFESKCWDVTPQLCQGKPCE